MVKELVSGNRTEIAVATIDGDPVAVQNINNGTLTVVDSAQFFWHLGSQAMLAGLKAMQGDPELPSTVLLPVFPITAETIDQFPGWINRIPSPFSKPWASTKANWKWEMTTPEGKVVKLKP